MLPARAGRSRRIPSATMVLAWFIWSGVKLTSSPRAVARHSSPPTRKRSRSRSVHAQVPPATRPSATTPATTRGHGDRGRASPARSCSVTSGVGVQGVVERDALTIAVARLDTAGERVADEEQRVPPGELGRLDDRAVRQPDLGAGGDVQAGLDDAVVAEGDADARLRADEAAAADGDPLGAAAGEGAHGG